jgi:putative aldouronate transport system substrate-binding protein
VATTYQFLASPPQVVQSQGGYDDVAKDYAAWQADAVKHAVKPLFYSMNVTEPAQYASIGQPVEDIMKDVRAGRKTMADFDEAVKTWKAQGGTALAAFYEDIRTKFGTGQ